MNDPTRRFLSDQTGTSAIEYGRIAALVSIAAMCTFQLVGESLVTVFLDGVANVLVDAAAST